MVKKQFDPASDKPFALSRSKVDLYMDCPRCFYRDRRLGIARPAWFPFNLNSAVDALLKKEFDAFRARGEPHPLMSGAGLNASRTKGTTTGLNRCSRRSAPRSTRRMLPIPRKAANTASSRRRRRKPSGTASPPILVVPGHAS